MAAEVSTSWEVDDPRPQTALMNDGHSADSKADHLHDETAPLSNNTGARGRSPSLTPAKSRPENSRFRPHTAGLFDPPLGLEDSSQSGPRNAGPVGTSRRSEGPFPRPRSSPLPSHSRGGGGGGLSRMRRKDYQELKELATYGRTLKPLDRKRMASSKAQASGSAENEASEERKGEARRLQSPGSRKSGQPPSSAYPEIESPPAIMMQRAMSPPRYTVARRPHTTGSVRSQLFGGAGSSDAARKKGGGPSVGREKRGGPGSLNEVSVDEAGNVTLSGKMGGRYVGEMAGGLPEGQGQHWVPETKGGDMRLLYEGEWMLGVKMGRGTIYYRNGQSYTGDVVDGDRHGIGRLTYSSGDVYHGAWFHGRKVGYGIQFYADTTIYAGMWANDHREGMATFYWPNRGKKYTGEWVKNAPVCGSVESIRTGEIDGLQYPAPQRPFATRSENLDLPPLEVLQPGLSVYEKVTAVRGARAAWGARSPVAAKEKLHSACLRPFQIEALKHAFVTIAGGMRFDNRVRTSKILDVCLTAGFRPDSKEMNTLMKSLVEKAHGSGMLTFDAFLEAILWLQM